MPYNETIAQRIREFLLENNVEFSEKKMFMGLCFMVDDKLCCGTHTDKKLQEELLFCRVSDEVYEQAVERDDVLPMEHMGRAMKNYIFVTEEGHKTKKEFTYWLQACLDYNPIVKSKKK